MTMTQILDVSDKEQFLILCTSQIQDMYAASENDVECVDVTENVDVTSMIDVTLGSNNGQSMITTVKTLILDNGLDLLSVGEYDLYEDLVTFTVTYVNDFETWSAAGSEDVTSFAGYCAVKIAAGNEGDYSCSEPVADENNGQVVISYTVPSSEQSTVMVMVASGNFMVGGYAALEAVADPSTCEKVDQADVVIWFNDDGTLFLSKDMEKEAGTCFPEMTTMDALADRTLIDELTGYNLQTTIAVFAAGSTMTNSMVDYVAGLGYLNVLNAESFATVQAARDSNGCECSIAQATEVTVVEVDSYDLETGGLLVGVLGVFVFFLLCVVCVSKRDAWFSDAEEVAKIMKEQDDILDKIRQTEESDTTKKVLPKWESGVYAPGRGSFDKEDCRVKGKLTEDFSKSMMAAQETQEMV